MKKGYRKQIKAPVFPAFFICYTGELNKFKKTTFRAIMYEQILQNLKKSAFRSKFRLKEKEKLYISEKGLETIESHAHDFIAKRIAPAVLPNDGKQTPMKGHPVFIAQHATACCCRGCINKWHKFPKNVQLTQKQQDYLVGLIMEWIKRQLQP